MLAISLVTPLWLHLYLLEMKWYCCSPSPSSYLPRCPTPPATLSPVFHLLEEGTSVAPLSYWPPTSSHTLLVAKRATMVQGAMMVALRRWILLMMMLMTIVPAPCSPLLLLDHYTMVLRRFRFLGLS